MNIIMDNTIFTAINTDISFFYINSHDKHFQMTKSKLRPLHAVITPLSQHGSTSFLSLTLLRTLWQYAMSGSKMCELKSSEPVSSDRRRLPFTRYTLDTYGTFHTPLKNETILENLTYQP